MLHSQRTQVRGAQYTTATVQQPQHGYSCLVNLCSTKCRSITGVAAYSASYLSLPPYLTCCRAKELLLKHEAFEMCFDAFAQSLNMHLPSQQTNLLQVSEANLQLAKFLYAFAICFLQAPYTAPLWHPYAQPLLEDQLHVSIH